MMIFLLKFFFSVGMLLLLINGSRQLTSNANKSANKYPYYSLQNMPKTDFSCRDKILGGYYADADTQCQMFHICVKVAGVGVSWTHFLLLLIAFISCAILLIKINNFVVVVYNY